MTGGMSSRTCYTKHKTTDFISSEIIFFYYKCDIIENNSQTITCMGTQSCRSNECYCKQTNNTSFLKTVIEEYDMMISKV